jgi:DNA-binding FrmR family transcriptional regulator
MAAEHHHPPHTQTKAVMNRLARISGHVDAIKRMVEDGRDCSEILIQLAAVDSAVISVSKVILKDHIDHCIVDAVQKNDLQSIDELKKAIETFMK